MEGLLNRTSDTSSWELRFTEPIHHFTRSDSKKEDIEIHKLSISKLREMVQPPVCKFLGLV